MSSLDLEHYESEFKRTYTEWITLVHMGALYAVKESAWERYWRARDAWLAAQRGVPFAKA